jgi:hypothetical protein
LAELINLGAASKTGTYTKRQGIIFWIVYCVEKIIPCYMRDIYS